MNALWPLMKFLEICIRGVDRPEYSSVSSKSTPRAHVLYYFGKLLCYWKYGLWCLPKNASGTLEMNAIWTLSKFFEMCIWVDLTRPCFIFFPKIVYFWKVVVVLLSKKQCFFGTLDINAIWSMSKVLEMCISSVDRSEDFHQNWSDAPMIYTFRAKKHVWCETRTRYTLPIGELL